MPKLKIAAIVVFIVAGTFCIAFPFLPGWETVERVTTTISSCRGFVQRGSVTTYSTFIAHPPGEIRMQTDLATVGRIDDGYRRACQSKLPVRIDYAKGKSLVEDTFWVRGMQGVDGTSYFSVEDSRAARKADHLLAIPFGLFLYFGAFLALRNARRKAAGIES